MGRIACRNQSNHSRARACRAPAHRAHFWRGVGIQWRLLGYLSIFVLFILIVLWIFQIHLLVPFYENIKSWELEKTADRLSTVLKTETEDTDKLNQAVWEVAEQYSICVTLWRVENNVARYLVDADVSDTCIIHRVTGVRRLRELYAYAKENGGSYSCKVLLYTDGILWMEEDGTVRRDEEDAGQAKPSSSMPELEREAEGSSALYMRLTTGADGREYIILLDADLTPLSATVGTLQMQFFWIAVLLLSGALLLAYLMSKRISRPLVRMNETALSLGKGQYDVHFVGNGYRETRELAETLNYAADELSKTDRLQKELIANISHDLRTPLTMITGYGEVMRDLPEENTPENVQVIIDEARRLSDLVNDLLDLSRLQAGVRLPEPEVFDLTETVRAVLTRYETLTRHEGYHITFHAEGDAFVFADRTMLLQVVYNLINNAIQYCGEEKNITVTQQLMADGEVRIAVADDGQGIAPEQLPYIWDRYYKIDRVHCRSKIGTGLGLSIVKGILEQHHARYGVNSEPGVGSEFWFSLPLHHREEQTSAEED